MGFFSKLFGKKESSCGTSCCEKEAACTEEVVAEACDAKPCKEECAEACAEAECVKEEEVCAPEDCAGCGCGCAGDEAEEAAE